MAVIIGAGTIVGGAFANSCVISANWGYNPNTQRLYCLGSFSPTQTIDRPTETLSLTIYSAPGGDNPTYDTVADTDCVISNGITATVTPAGCEYSEDPIVGDWFVVNYGFSKDDPLLLGQETWGLQRWVASGDITTPTYVIRGISEGSTSPTSETDDYNSDRDAETGVHLTGATARSHVGNVTAGGIGRADIIYYGVVSSVGGSEYAAVGKTGQGSVSMPYTPLWL